MSGVRDGETRTTAERNGGTESAVMPQRPDADAVLNEIAVGAQLRFPVSCSSERKRALLEVDQELSRAGCPKARWAVFGAWLAAGAHGTRARSRPGTLPDIGYFLPIGDLERDGRTVQAVRQEFLLLSVGRAIEWDEHGREAVVTPQLPAARGKAAGGVPRSEVVSHEEMAEAAREAEAGAMDDSGRMSDEGLRGLARRKQP